MPDDATLKDVTAAPNPSPADVKEPAKQEPVAPVVTDKEASEIGKILMDSGYTKEQLNDLLQAPQALQSLRYLIENNPSELVATLERNNPEVAKRFLEQTSDAWLQRNKQFIPSKQGDGGGKKDVPSELMSEVESLRSELDQVKTREAQRQQASTLAQVQSRYNARVEDLFGQLPKDLGLTKTEQTALRALLDKQLADDPIAVQRVSQGNFIDVPRKFQSILDGWSGDKKAAVKAEQDAREAAKRGAHVEFTPGANPFLIDVPQSATESWDATEDAFAKALENSR